MNARLNADAAGALIAALVEGGLARAIISPGSRSTPLVLAAAAHPDLDCRIVLDERAAAFIALGLARGCRQPVALICTSGSAAGHYLPAVMEASASRLPLILLTADRPPELHDCGAGQTLDQTRLFGPFVRWFKELGAPAPGLDLAANAAAVAARALERAARAPAGPVHLNLAYRKPLWEPGAEPRLSAPSITSLAGPRRLDDEAIAALARRLTKARRGLIFAGIRSPRDRDPAPAAAADLAARLGWPILAEAASALRFGAHDRRAIIAAAEPILRSAEGTEDLAPELVLRFGQAPTSKALALFLDQAPAIIIDEGGLFPDPGHAARIHVAAEEGATLSALANAVLGPPDPSWLARWRAAERRIDERWASRAFNGEVWGGAIARALVAALPAGSALHIASSLAIRDVDAYAAGAPKDLELTANRGANGIDGTLATAIGAALAHPERLTAVLLGDLAFLHDVGALAAAALLEGPLLIVVVDNEGGGIFDHLPSAAHPRHESHFITRQPHNIEAIARAFGLEVDTSDELGAIPRVLEQARSRPRPTLLRLIVERGRDLAARQAFLSASVESEAAP